MYGTNDWRDYLKHYNHNHGPDGRFTTSNGGARYIDPKTTLYRVSYSKNKLDSDIKDPKDKLKVKYFSINKKDNKEWQKYFKLEAKKYNLNIHQKTYTVNEEKKLRIATSSAAGHIFTDMYFKKNKKFLEAYQRLDDGKIPSVEDQIILINNKKYYKALEPYRMTGRQINMKDKNKIYSQIATGQISKRTKMGKKFVKKLKKEGFDGVEDVWGQDVAKDPIILFDPDKNVKVKTQKQIYKARY